MEKVDGVIPPQKFGWEEWGFRVDADGGFKAPRSKREETENTIKWLYLDAAAQLTDIT